MTLGVIYIDLVEKTDDSISSNHSRKGKTAESSVLHLVGVKRKLFAYIKITTNERH